MNIRTHHDDFTGTTYTVTLTSEICASFIRIAMIGDMVSLIGGSTVILSGSTAERFLTEWQRVTGQRVGLPVNAEDF